MKQSDSIAKLAPALVAAQSELSAVAKDSTNPHFKNRYASLDIIVETVRPILTAHGLALLQGASSPVTDEAGGLCGFAVDTMLVHSSGEWISNSAIMPLAKIDPQGAGGALTYGRRYGLSALLSLSTEEDDDGNTASHRPNASAAASRSPASSAPSTSNGSTGTSNTSNKAAAEKVMPFGKTKGKKLGDLPAEDLESTLKWCREKDAEKFKDLIAAIRAVLNDRSVGVASGDDFPAALRDESDSLPF